MRPLVLVCQAKDMTSLHQAVNAFVHPAVKRFITVVEVTLQYDEINSEKLRVIDACRIKVAGAINSEPLVCATKTVGQALWLSSALRPFGFEYQEHSVEMLAKTMRSDATPLMQRVLTSCGLTVRAAATENLRAWAHHDVDAQVIDSWVRQFGKLGVSTKIPQAILAGLRLVSSSELGTLLLSGAAPTGALCVNNDERTHGKSADVIANLLVKRQAGATVYKTPADAVDKGHTSLTIYEDGLFTGTEAVGILESLLGERKPERTKTRPLSDASMFPKLDLHMSYAMGTDYGRELVQLFLKERGFDNVSVQFAEQISLTDPIMLNRIGQGEWPLADLWEQGPPETGLQPHFMTQAEALRNLSDAERGEATSFCADVGRQLFYNYTQEMKRRKPSFTDWADAKLDRCAWGMWGQGLTISFGHSVPKATLPLIWGIGQVSYAGKTTNWAPLLPQAW